MSKCDRKYELDVETTRIRSRVNGVSVMQITELSANC